MEKATNGAEGRHFPGEGEVELRGNRGERSATIALKEGEDGKEADTSKLLEEILSRDNLNLAYKRVKKNRGSHGVDGMPVGELLAHLKLHGQTIRQKILNGEYKPQPVRRVEIPKPDGGVRLLGIPTVLDRMIQQAIAQVLMPIFEEEFSDHSYGFRPGRSAHQAVKQAQAYIAEGYTVVVDIDLEKFFDRVNHDKLMYRISRRIKDKRVLKLIRAYLESGVMIGGLVSPTEEGTPQGGPLSPLLSNVALNELDKELEKRGHRFCRYADDCNIYVKSKRAGERVMQSVTQFIEKRLKLRVNREKSAVDYPEKRKFLGFSFYRKKDGIGIRVHAKSFQRFKEKVRVITSRSNAWSMTARIDRLRKVITGWVNYFGIADMERHCRTMDEWIRRRLRMCHWKQWKKIKTKHDHLVRLGLPDTVAWQYANTRKGYWHTSNSPILSVTLNNIYFRNLSLIGLSDVYRTVL
jgi:group II intron reverse transcriptase/maturase